MRYIAARVGLGAALVVGGLATAVAPASAAPTQSRPSSLVLTIASGETPADSTVVAETTLTCAPEVGGGHGYAAQACAELQAANGDFEVAMKRNPTAMCPTVYEPHWITAKGVWEGKPVSFTDYYASRCDLDAEKSLIFKGF